MHKIIFILLVFISANAVFADAQWVGTTSRAWNVGSNWNLGLVPTTTDQAIIYAAPDPVIDSNTTVLC